ncbi:L,D-transpeptidase family protein [Streptomyces sp. NBC_01176]|uniref:L,D-transpeptidase family protein n=1 Tax=Streptomyces sp. NBC_01176 TaxID=2903760 RepID=UPI0038662774|nr:L,D-transpeptidase family protein [Streptomyces sp. NBC_01176]
MTTEERRTFSAAERPKPHPGGGHGASLRPKRIVAATVVLAALVSGCAGFDARTDRGERMSVREDGANAGQTTRTQVPSASTTTGPPATPVPRRLPGVGPGTLARIPPRTRQVLLVTGAGRNSSKSGVVLYRRTDAGWEPGPVWPAHNALKGWTHDHHAGDLRSPVGVFTLTDAGGRLADPGSRLPYDRSAGFTVHGTGFEGEPLAGSFDYVIAIGYNHEPGTSPLDWTRPMGAGKGGGIWLHVDHGGPTHGCVSLAEGHMRELLRTLDPAQHPLIVMGDAASLTA